MKRILLFIFIVAGTLPLFAQQKIMCTPPTVVMSADVTICAGQSATITSTGSGTSAPYTYDWSPAVSVNCPSGPTCGTTTATPAGTTTYTCIVTDGLSCTASGIVTVTVNLLPGVGISGAASSICTGSSAILTGTGATSYSWSTTQVVNPITVSPTTSTTYTVWGTDGNGCSNTSTATVNVNTLPSISISGAVASICNGTSATLTGSGGTSYSWSDTQIINPITVSPTTSTTYTVWGTDGNGCSNTDVATVNVNTLPTVSIGGGSTSICSGNSATLTGSGGTSYSWSTGAVTNPITVSPTTSTTYTVWGTDGNGCSNTDVSTVDIFAPVVAGFSGNSPICFGQSATLTATGGTSYSWWNNGSTSNPLIDNPTTTTSYTVTATDGNGCTDDVTFSLTVNPLPTANAGPDVSICTGSNTTLTATGNGTYLWSPSTDLSCTTCANPTANPTATITYTVTVTNSCGSIDDNVTITITSTASVNAGIDATICLGNSASLIASGSGTYAWSPSTGLSNTTIANPVATPTTSTNYTVTITTGCGTAEDSVWVIIDVPVATVGGTSPICNGTSSTLCATGGGTYLWDNSSTTSCITVSPAVPTGYTVTITDGFSCTATATMTVSVNALPTASITGNSSICSGVNDTLVATGGITYLWNTSATTDTLIVNLTSATVYSITVTDGNGCTNSTSFSVSVNPLPTANAGTDATICSGFSTTLIATGGGPYNWSPSTGLSNTTIANPIANPTATTTYTVAVTNSCGTAVDSVVVNVNSLPVVSITGNSTLCIGSSDTLVATGGGTYLWNTTSTNDSIFVSPTSATGYTVTVTNGNGCTNTANFTVNISSVTASITGTSAICSGQNATLTASGGGTYLWNTTATTTSITVSPTGTTNYTVTATNSLGCTDAATFSVNVTAQPTASITATTTTLCSGSATSLNASGGTTYVWSPTTGLTNSTVSNPVATPTTNITYTVIVSNGVCADTASISISVSANPTVTVTASASAICVGDTATLSASGGTNYLWQPGGQTTSAITANPASATTYTVTTTDANGCTDNTTTLINVLNQVNLLVSGDTSLCSGEPTTLTAQGGGTYSWSTGATTSAIVVNPTSNTSYTVTGSNGACTDTDTINVNVYALPTALATASPYTINIGNQTTLTGVISAGSYNWSWASSTNPLTCATCPNPVANPTATTTYTLCITDANGCTSCDTVTVNVLIECEELFVPSAFSPYPDGHNDILYVRSPCIETMDWTIYNRWGQKVFFSDDITKGWDGIVNGKDADAAVFFYILNVTLITNDFIVKEGNVTLVR